MGYGRVGGLAVGPWRRTAAGNAATETPDRVMTTDVFVSYSSHDKRIADQLCRTLEHAGISVWIAPRNIKGGIWAEQIVQAINACRIMLVIVSTASLASKEVAREVGHAASTSAKILPFFAEEIGLSGSLTYYLASVQWFDGFRYPPAERDEALLRTVREMLDAPASTSQVPSDLRHSTPLLNQIRLAVWSVRRAVWRKRTAIVITILTSITLFGAFAVYWFTTPSDAATIIALSRVLHSDFLEAGYAKGATGVPNFAKPREDIAAIRALDRNNATALYYEGEILRRSNPALFDGHGCPKQSDSAIPELNLESYEDQFRLYLDNMSSLPAAQTGGRQEAAICYSRANGYCVQRTAWIYHLLANDFLVMAEATRDPLRRKAMDDGAYRFAEEAIALFASKDDPHRGFDQCISSCNVACEAKYGTGYCSTHPECPAVGR